jgi:hypothetical protein
MAVGTQTLSYQLNSQTTYAQKHTHLAWLLWIVGFVITVC